MFVDISINTTHLLATLEKNFPLRKTIAIVRTIQFNTTLYRVRVPLEKVGYNIMILQITPLREKFSAIRLHALLLLIGLILSFI